MDRDNRNGLPAAVELERISRAAKAKLLPSLEESPIRDFAYAIKARVKPPEDVLRKVARKRATAASEKDRSYGVEHVTDGCGARIVVRFQDDIPAVLKHLFAMIRHDSSVTFSAFIPNRVREVIIYTSRPAADPYSVVPRVEKVIAEAGVAGVTGVVVRDPVFKKSGYSSVHVVAEVGVSVESVERVAVVEIQVRDLFEEAWGEVEWALRYRLERERAPLHSDVESESLEETWKPYLNALKTICDGCSQHATFIRRHAIDPVPDTGEGQDHLSVEPTSELVDDLRKALHDAPGDLEALVLRAFAARERAQKSPDPGVVAKEFGEAIESLRELMASEPLTGAWGSRTVESRTVVQQLELELAFCLSRPGASDDELDEAAERYRRLRDELGPDPVVLYRSGLVSRNQGDYEQAVTALKEANSQLGKDHVPQGSWLWSAVNRQLGYTYWLMSQGVDVPERGPLMDKALRSSRAALREAETRGLEREQVLALNNTAYFAAEDLLSGRRVPASRRRELARLVKQLATVAEEGDLLDRLRRGDTLLCGLQALGRIDEAVEYANQLFAALCEVARLRSGMTSLTTRDIAKYLEGDFAEIYGHVSDVFRVHGTGNPKSVA